MCSSFSFHKHNYENNPNFSNKYCAYNALFLLKGNSTDKSAFLILMHINTYNPSHYPRYIKTHYCLILRIQDNNAF